MSRYRGPKVSTEKISAGTSAIAAGMWVKTDATRGVWKTPAGTRAQAQLTAGKTKTLFRYGRRFGF